MSDQPRIDHRIEVQDLTSEDGVVEFVASIVGLVAEIANRAEGDQCAIFGSLAHACLSRMVQNGHPACAEGVAQSVSAMVALQNKTPDEMRDLFRRLLGSTEPIFDAKKRTH